MFLPKKEDRSDEVTTEALKFVKWFLDNFPFRLESIDAYLCEALHSRTTAGGFIQLLPGIHETDGFFIARLRRIES